MYPFDLLSGPYHLWLCYDLSLPHHVRAFPRFLPYQGACTPRLPHTASEREEQKLSLPASSPYGLFLVALTCSSSAVPICARSLLATGGCQLLPYPLCFAFHPCPPAHARLSAEAGITITFRHGH